MQLPVQKMDAAYNNSKHKQIITTYKKGRTALKLSDLFIYSASVITT